jgi:hypothetical protein
MDECAAACRALVCVIGAGLSRVASGAGQGDGKEIHGLLPLLCAGVALRTGEITRRNGRIIEASRSGRCDVAHTKKIILFATYEGGVRSARR